MSDNSFIGSGEGNVITFGSEQSFISGGTQNNIGALLGGGCGSVYGGIGGGCMNCIDDTGAQSCYGIIGNGLNNKICAGTNHSSIFSGNGNTVAGSCSSILGGSGNSDGGFNYVGIFGQGITANAGNTFFVEGLNACSIPHIIGGVGALPGQIYWDVPPAPDANPKALYIG